MATDYREVLAELRAEEARLESDLEAIRAMIPGAEVMVRRMATATIDLFSAPKAPSWGRPFAGMGIRQAIIRLLAGSDRPMMPSDITRRLIEGGVETKAADFSGNVSSTLTQMRQDEIVDRVEDGWTLMHRPDAHGNPPMNVSATSPAWIAISNALRQQPAQ